MVATPQFPPRLRRLFWIFWTAFAGFATLFGFVFFIGDVFGGNAVATVVDVSAQGAYTIRFTTRHGATCESPQKWTTLTGPVKVNDTFGVHYSLISPCDNVNREDDWFARYAPILIPPGFLAFGWINLRRLRQVS